jgi:hypothetical protein
MADSPHLERIGTGSVGGKGRALGYLNMLVAEHQIRGIAPSVVRVPPAVVITTEEFRTFVDENDLSHCLTTHDDELIVDAFLRGRVSHRFFNWLRRFVETHTRPLAVRSSSLNEDAYDHPFAGLYKTVLLPNSSPDPDARVKQLVQAIKLVYASTYLEAPKTYMRAYDLPIEDEAMAVVLQEVAGRERVSRFYPRLAGVARSLNYFPVGGLESTDGLCRLVVGLGVRALEGSEAASFAPRRPLVRPGHGSPQLIAKAAQRFADVLDLTRGEIEIADERAAIRTLPLEHLRKDGVLEDLESWWNREDDTLYEGGLKKGEPLLTFQRLLRGEIFPFTDALAQVLDRAEAGFRGPVEIEFAADFDRGPSGPHSELNLLQVRRIGRPRTGESVELAEVPGERLLFTSTAALGNGIWAPIHRVVYVPPGPRSSEDFLELARKVGEIDQLLGLRRHRYLLVGPGRWGSRNRSQGIPVTYNQVAHAGGIVEVSTGDFHPQPSQGTHFFHNITAGEVFYISIDLTAGDHFATEWFDAQPDARGQREPGAKLIELEHPLVLRVDGRTQRAQLYREPPS